MAGEVDDPVRRELFDQMQAVLAGRPVASGFAAAVDLLGCLTAFLSEDPAHADAMLDLTLGDLKRDIRVNWAETREARARAVVVGRA